MIELFGTVYRLHPLFVLMMAAALLIGHFVELLVLFGVVVVHELGHVAAARWFGWRVREVRLLPFGGVAVADPADGADSVQETAVALAGPLQNLLMIGFAFFFRLAGWWADEWTDWFVRVNMTVGLFNLLPVEPLDGGRILSAWISRRASVWTTMNASGGIGLAGSLAMAVHAFLPFSSAGLKANLLAIAAFLAVHNATEWKNRHYRLLRFLVRRQREDGLLLARRLPARVIAVRDMPAKYGVFKRFMRERYQLVAVLDERGRVVRILSERELLDDFLQTNGAPAPNMLE